MNDKPRILIFTGDGKGKTTAALGMAFRASGHGLRSCIIQFIKSDASVGEIAAAADSTLVEIHPTGLGFVPSGDESAVRRASGGGAGRPAQSGRNHRRRSVRAGDSRRNLLAVARGLIDEQQVVELVAKAPPEMCLVLTGRDATPGLDRPGRHRHRNASASSTACTTGAPRKKGVER